jgi:hypothetical protein
VDVLDDDVLSAISHTQTLSTDNTLGSNADQGLVGANVDTGNTSGVVGNADRLDASTSVAVCAPRGLVDGVLAAGAGALVGGWPAACFGGGTFGALKVVPETQGQCLLRRYAVADESAHSLSSTMQRAVLSVSHVFSCATLDGIAQAALPPPVVPVAKPTGLPTTA